MNEMQTKVRTLIKRHCNTLQTEMAAVDASLDELETVEVAALKSVLTMGIERVHRIKGSSGSSGFAAISACAAQLEKALRTARANQDLDAATRQAIFEGHTALKQLVAAVEPEQSCLWDTDFSHFSK